MPKKVIHILLIVVISTFLRIVQLDKVPPALFGDEVDVGYQAYSILKTGEDLYGRFLPIYIKSLAEYRAPLYIYSAVPFVGIFGLNEWGVRLPAVFWGVISILGLYLLAKELLDQKVALISSLLLSISPWHLQYSRASFEVTMLLSFYIFSIYFFILGLERRIFLLFCALLFGLTVYIYSTAILFTPLILLTSLVVYRKELLKHKKYLIAPLLTLGITVLPMVSSIYKGEARGRFNVISIFQESVLLDKINLARYGQRYTSPDGALKVIDPKIEVIFHNRPAIFVQVFTLNYLRAFSFDFLFGTGDPNFRHSIHEMGLLYLFEIPLILLGLRSLMLLKSKKIVFIILSWLLLAPIPSALTYDGGWHATRLLIMLPPLVILSGLGLDKIFHLPKHQMGFTLLIVFPLAVISVAFYLHRYFVHYPIESWRWWHVGFKEAFNYIADNQDNYQLLVINNSYEPSLARYLFFTKYDPATFHQQFKSDKPSKNILPGFDGFSLNEKVYFGTINDEAKKSGGFEMVMKPSMIYLASARDEITINEVSTYKFNNFLINKAILDPSGKPIFYILTGK